MDKGTHFIGQPMYGQLISLLDKSKILKFSREKGGERYVKHFDAWQHLVIMLYAVIKRFDSLREITGSMFPEARKFSHLGIRMMPRRSTLSDANARRSEGQHHFPCFHTNELLRFMAVKVRIIIGMRKFFRNFAEKND